jgi:hypothetical protein
MAGGSKMGKAPHNSSYMDPDGIAWAWDTVQKVRNNNSQTPTCLHGNPSRGGLTVPVQLCPG